MTNKIDNVTKDLKTLYYVLQSINYTIVDTLDDYTDVFDVLCPVDVDVLFNDNDLIINLYFDDNYKFYVTFTKDDKNKNVFVYKQLNICCY